MSNPIPPSVTPPSPNEFEVTRRTITGITQNNIAEITSVAHGFTSTDEGVTTVNFMQVQGMRQINALPGRIVQVIDADHFTVNINTTNFYPYSSGGIFIIDTGSPALEQASFQYFNTPFQNIA